jgi:hypothetical protein
VLTNSIDIVEEGMRVAQAMHQLYATERTERLVVAVKALCDEAEALRQGLERAKQLRKDVYYDSRERVVADEILKGFESYA